MQRTYEHMKNFSNCLIRKGYDGLFTSTFGFPDRIHDNLIKHVLECMEQKRDIGPFTLRTYSHWDHREMKPYVVCNFHVNYKEPAGFNVSKMVLEYGNEYGSLRTKELLPRNNEEIPTADDSTNMMLSKNIKKLRL